MSDILATDASGGTPAPSAPDFSAPDVGDSSSQTFEDGNGGGSFESTPTADPDYDKIFGLEPEVKETPVSDPNTPDVAEPTAPATDPPVTRQDTEVETPQEPKVEDAEAPKAEEPKKDTQSDLEEKLNFDSAPEHFRTAFRELKENHLRLIESHPEAQYLQDPEKFRDWMKETSPTSYQQVGQMLVSESVQAHPKEWADYLLQTNPDTIAEALSGREGMTMDKLKGVLELYDPETDDEDIAAGSDKQKAQAQPPETPEQKKIRELLEREEQREFTQATQQVTQPIVSEVNQLVSQAGLDVDLDVLQGQDFTKLDEDTQFKVFVNTMMPAWIDQRIEQNPQIAAMQARMEYFLSNKDEKGQPKKVDVESARKLMHPMKIAVTNFVNEFLGVATTRRAQAKQKDTAPPNQTPPPPQVRSAGASQGVPPVPTGGNLDWSGDMNKW
jgi:hypothetical protein